MISIFKHLLPRARAWRITIDKTLRQFFEGLAAATVDDTKENFDNLYSDLDPQQTRDLPAWEAQFALPDTGLTEQERRDRLEATWEATGGQSPKYIQDTLQNAGFPVYVHEWWDYGVYANLALTNGEPIAGDFTGLTLGGAAGDLTIVTYLGELYCKLVATIATAYVEIDGEVGTTDPCTFSVWASTSSVTGAYLASTDGNIIDIQTGTPIRRHGTITPSGTTVKMRIVGLSGTTTYFKLPQITVGSDLKDDVPALPTGASSPSSPTPGVKECVTPYDPTALIIPPNYPLVNKIPTITNNYLVLAGEALAQAGEPTALAGNFTYSEGRVVYTVPTDPDEWCYFLYIGGETFGTFVNIPTERKDEFEDLCLKICPCQLWIGLFVNFT